MAGEVPSKGDINAIFKRLRSIPTNKQCFDCGAINPTWASVTYGVFLCIDCSAVHRSLGVHVTFIRSIQLDTSWTWLQLRAMQVGGNASATAFFRQHGCTSNDSQQKYHSRAAQMYREKLHSLALKTMHQHGTKLHIDHLHAGPSSPQGVKEVDFFKEHENAAPPTANNDIPSTGSMKLSEPVPISNGTLSSSNKPEDPDIGPSVEAALSMSPTEAQQIAEPRKATIGARKPAAAKKGLGGKKGLGAQKVKANFSDIENAAQQRDKDKLELEANMAAKVARTKEEEDKKMASMRLAYKDLSVEEKKRDEQMKKMDPKKAQQMERLGMGMGSGANANAGKTHSAFSDMKTIEQESAQNSYDRYSSRGRQRDRDFDDDDFEIIGGGFSSGPPKYDDSPFGLKKEDRYSSNFGANSKNNKSSTSWDAEDRFGTKQSTFSDETASCSSNREREDERGRSRASYDVSTSDEAQKKFGNAKAISSDAYFGKNDPDVETRQTLSKFEGSASISSAQFFGREETTSSSRGGKSNYNDYGGGPDLQEIKDGVKQGVTRVAGKLSNLANGVMNSLQDYSG